MTESNGRIKIAFSLTNEFGNTFTAESQDDIFDDRRELDIIGESLDTFMRQVGYIRSGDTVFMESVTDEECEFLADALSEYREAQKSVQKQDEQTIKVRYLSPAVPPLAYIGTKSDWVDLRAAEDVVMKTGEFKLIPLGIAIQLPRGYEAHIIPRSSTFKNFGVIQANHMGMVDESYCGDNDQWFFPAIAMRDTVIHAGDRICQFRIMEHQPQLHFEAVETLGNVDRGGIGSTGKR